MIIILSILLILTIGFLIRTNLKLNDHITNQHILTNHRRTDVATLRRNMRDSIEDSTLQIINIKSDLKKEVDVICVAIDKIRMEIPLTNDELLEEVQRMRDDFLALRQNL